MTFNDSGTSSSFSNHHHSFSTTKQTYKHIHITYTQDVHNSRIFLFFWSSIHFLLWTILPSSSSVNSFFPFISTLTNGKKKNESSVHCYYHYHHEQSSMTMDVCKQFIRIISEYHHHHHQHHDCKRSISSSSFNDNNDMTKHQRLDYKRKS